MANILPRSMANNAMLISIPGVGKELTAPRQQLVESTKNPTKTALRKKHLKLDLKISQGTTKKSRM